MENKKKRKKNTVKNNYARKLGNTCVYFEYNYMWSHICAIREQLKVNDNFYVGFTNKERSALSWSVFKGIFS